MTTILTHRAHRKRPSDESSEGLFMYLVIWIPFTNNSCLLMLSSWFFHKLIDQFLIREPWRSR